MKEKAKHNKQYKTKHSVPKVKKAITGSISKRKLPTKERTSSTRDIYNPVSVEEYESVKSECERLRQLNRTMQRENNRVISLARDGRIDAFDESFKTTVVAVTKRVVYPRCPYVSNPIQLEKCMVILAAELELTESKKNWFCVGFKHTVNSAIAARRNSDIQCIRRELKALGNKAPRYEDIKDLRMTVDEKKKDAVYIFYKHIMPCVCGKKNWKNKFKKETISQTSTVSLEALALWILHNYEEKWRSGENHNKVHALYTGLTKGNKMFTGWDNEGINKYNELCNFVRQNRIGGSEFEIEIQTRMIKEDKEENNRGRHRATIPVACFDDLDEKLQDLPRAALNNAPLQTTVVCNMNTGISEVASTISSSSASTSYRSAGSYKTGTSDDDDIHSVAI